MYKINLGKTGLEVPTIAVGCMRITSLDKKELNNFINTSMELGANFFDHADIYGGGECESKFADAIEMNDNIREKMIIQTKCGIVPGKRYDFSKEHIIKSVDGSLKRLKTDYIDVLLLHRPDALVEPEEVGEAFEILKSSGKVHHFGVSNQNARQMQLLNKYLKEPLCANQLQFGIMHSSIVDSGINVNMKTPRGTMYDDGILDHCRLTDTTIQAWSPFQYGFFEGCFIGSEKFPKLNEKLSEIADKYNTTPTSVATAWILRHPAKIMPVTGTTNIKRLTECINATEYRITGEEWYEIYLSAENVLP